MSNTDRLFLVTLTDPISGRGVRLPIPRTEAQVKVLEGRYPKVVAVPTKAEPKVPSEAQDAFHTALVDLVRLYRSAEAQGDRVLARRAEEAVAALLGDQRHLKGDNDKPMRVALDRMPDPRQTLRGIGRTDRVR
jgi:hypothetical protein